MTEKLPHRLAMEQLRNELLPINYIELSHKELILGSGSGCTTLNHSDLCKLIIALVALQRELHERQVE